MRTVRALVGFVFLAGVTSSAFATFDWSGNIYNSGGPSSKVTNDPGGVIQSHINGGSPTGGSSINVNNPLGKNAMVSFGSSANIWSATNDDFGYDATNGAWFGHINYGAKSSATILKLNLSTPANNFYWQPCAGYANLSSGNRYDWKISLDGVNWITNQSLTAATGGNYSPVSARTVFGRDVTTLYLGYFATNNGSGYSGISYQYNTGAMYFYESTGAPEPATLIMLGLGGLAMLRRRK